MPTTVPLLIISGSMGAGKTTVLSEASDLLAQAGIPHAAIDLDWLSVMHQRLRVRGPGMFQDQALARSTELDGILERAAIECFTVDNGPGRLVTDVAHEVLTRAGWL